MTKKDKTFLKFLNLCWLRPENALSMTMRSKALRPYLQNINGLSIDISGGDGISTFITAGGELDKDFDIFRTVGSLSKVREHAADIYDHFEETYSPLVTKVPDFQINWISDWKENLLKKAKSLHWYNNYLLQDNNLALDLKSDSFGFIFSNSAYWVKEIDFFLTELNRILKNDGTIVLQVKNSLQFENTFRDIKQLSSLSKGLLDRGRSFTYQSLADEDEWLRRFERAGFNLLERTPIATKDIRQIVDIGLRPWAPVTIKMANNLEPSVRSEVKAEWIEICYDLLEGFAYPGSSFGVDERVAEYQYVLSKK